VAGRVVEGLGVNKQRLHKFNMKRFNLNKLNVVEGKEKYHIEVSTALGAD
jgi:hypothetical protein